MARSWTTLISRTCAFFFFPFCRTLPKRIISARYRCFAVAAHPPRSALAIFVSPEPPNRAPPRITLCNCHALLFNTPLGTLLSLPPLLSSLPRFFFFFLPVDSPCVSYAIAQVCFSTSFFAFRAFLDKFITQLLLLPTLSTLPTINRK
jgi:hypothetical protein